MMTASFLGSAKKPGVLVMHNNITSRVLHELEAEEQLAQLLNLTKSRREYEERLDQFYSMISHDIRGPVCSVLSAIRFVNEYHSGQLAAEARELLSSAELGAEAVLNLVTDFLDRKRIQENRLPCQMEPVDCAQLASYAALMMYGLAQSAGVNIIVDTNPAPAFCNPNAIVRVLTNILSNAIKFTPAGKNVYLETSMNGRKSRITVRDEGPGIDEDTCRHLFEPFAVAKRSEILPASGLGLSISKSLLEQHNSFPVLESSPFGTTIYFELDAIEYPYLCAS
jgi:signal transduction histidine kinase